MKKELIIVNPHCLEGYSFNWEKAYTYAKLMEQGIEFPPIRLHKSLDGKLIIRNGMHRTVAAKLCGMEIVAEVATRDYSEDDYFEDYENGYKIR
jgi:hypothetical protein